MKSIFILICIGLLTQVACAGKIQAKSLHEMNNEAKIIVVGKIVSVKEQFKDAPGIQIAVVEASSTIKGNLVKKRFKVRLHWYGSKAFDPKVKIGESVVLWISGIENGVATLSYRGAIASFKMNHFLP